MQFYNSFDELAAATGNNVGTTSSFQTEQTGQVLDTSTLNTLVWNMSNFTSAPYTEGSKSFWFGATSRDQGKARDDLKNEGPHVHVNPEGIPTTTSHQYKSFKILLCSGPNRDQLKAISFGGVPQPVIDRTLKHVAQNRDKFLQDWDKFINRANTGATNDTPEAAQAREAARKQEKRRQGHPIPEEPYIP